MKPKLLYPALLVLAISFLMCQVALAGDEHARQKGNISFEAVPAESVVTNQAVGGCADLILDGSMEASLATDPITNPFWASTSTYFGTVLCNDSYCGTGGGTSVPRTGTYWAWFGGSGSEMEIGTLSQSVVIPGGTTTLSFYYWNGVSGSGADSLVVSIDGNTIFTAFAGDPAYTAGYTLVSIDVSAFADGAAHTILFVGTQTTTSNTNMAVDDISLTTCPFTAAVTVDPLGKFLLYTSTGGVCTDPVVYYLALDANGHAAGEPFPIVDCVTVPGGVKGLDLLRDPSSGNYWVAFGSADAAAPKFLMEIDPTGHVIMDPVAALAPTAFGSTPGPLAIANFGCCKLHMWTIGAGGYIYRAVISKSSMIALSCRNTKVMAVDPISLNATQGASDRFLAFTKPVDMYRACGLNTKGLPDGTSWRLSPRTDGGHGLGGLSPDGLMALSSDIDPPVNQLYAQPLKSSTGLPEGNPVVVTPCNCGLVQAMDLSNPLANGRRFLVYFADSGSGAQLFLQVVNAVTGERMGARNLLVE